MIGSRIDKQVYVNGVDMEKDISLLVKNAKTYNEPNSQVRIFMNLNHHQLFSMAKPLGWCAIYLAELKKMLSFKSFQTKTKTAESKLLSGLVGLYEFYKYQHKHHFLRVMVHKIMIQRLKNCAQPWYTTWVFQYISIYQKLSIIFKEISIIIVKAQEEFVIKKQSGRFLLKKES